MTAPALQSIDQAVLYKGGSHLTHARSRCLLPQTPAMGPHIHPLAQFILPQVPHTGPSIRLKILEGLVSEKWAWKRANGMLY